MRQYLTVIFLVLAIRPSYLFSQDAVYTGKCFAETRVVNGHSVESNAEGVLKFTIFHRFGAINAGIYDFFGFDDANMRIGFDYGLKNWFTLGVGRSSHEKTYDGYIKFRLLRQKSGARNTPLSITLFSDVAFVTERYPGYDVELKHRTFYSTQLLIAHKFSEVLSLQVMPSLVHRNLVATGSEKNDIGAVGIAPKIQLSKRVSMNLEYYHVFPDQLSDDYRNSLAVGFDIETKGHVFSLNIGNSRGLINKVFIAETTDEWSEGEIHFGFNLNRDFKLKGRRYRSYNN